MVVETAEEAIRKGIPVVTITDHPLSPLATRSTVCFIVEDASVHKIRSLTASMCLAQTLAVSIGAAKNS